jgi:hypothetical protein
MPATTTKRNKNKKLNKIFFLFFFCVRWGCVRADASVLSPGNFIADARVRPSHGRPRGHRPIVCRSVIVRVTTLITMDHLLDKKASLTIYFYFIKYHRGNVIEVMSEKANFLKKLLKNI